MTMVKDAFVTNMIRMKVVGANNEFSPWSITSTILDVYCKLVYINSNAPQIEVSH